MELLFLIAGGIGIAVLVVIGLSRVSARADQMLRDREAGREARFPALWIGDEHHHVRRKRRERA